MPCRRRGPGRQRATIGRSVTRPVGPHWIESPSSRAATAAPRMPPLACRDRDIGRALAPCLGALKAPCAPGTSSSGQHDPGTTCIELSDEPRRAATQNDKAPCTGVDDGHRGRRENFRQAARRGPRDHRVGPECKCRQHGHPNRQGYGTDDHEPPAINTHTRARARRLAY